MRENEVQTSNFSFFFGFEFRTLNFIFNSNQLNYDFSIVVDFISDWML